MLSQVREGRTSLGTAEEARRERRRKKSNRRGGRGRDEDVLGVRGMERKRIWLGE